MRKIQYVSFKVEVRGLGVKEPKAIDFLARWIKAALVMAMTGPNKDSFNYCGQPKTGVVVTIEELA